jgi:2-dehydropantoate 2-reductase
MEHAILGVGGVGGLIAGALARAGQPVTLIVRPEALDSYPTRLRIESRVLGTFEVPVRAVARLDQPVDVVWVAVKATSLSAALEALPAAQLGEGVVIPLLNGLDHVQVLSEIYGQERVIAGAIRTHSERVAPAQIVHTAWHVPPGQEPLELAPSGRLRARAAAIAAELTAAGIPCLLRDDANAMLWSKLMILATLGLASTVAGSMGGARDDPRLNALMARSVHEVAAVAGALGVQLDPEKVLQDISKFAAASTTSLQRDLEAGRPMELEAIAGPPIREGRARGLDVSATEALRDEVARKAALVLSGQR